MGIGRSSDYARHTQRQCCRLYFRWPGRRGPCQALSNRGWARAQLWRPSGAYRPRRGYSPQPRRPSRRPDYAVYARRAGFPGLLLRRDQRGHHPSPAQHLSHDEGLHLLLERQRLTGAASRSGYLRDNAPRHRRVAEQPGHHDRPGPDRRVFLSRRPAGRSHRASRYLQLRT